MIVPLLAMRPAGTLRAARIQMAGSDYTSRTESEWRETLTPQEYDVLRKAGTEPPWSSPLNKLEEPGVLVCAGCETSLFRTSEKFESGSGWPSACSRLSSPQRALSAPIALSRHRAPCVQASGRPRATGRSRCAPTSSCWSRAWRCVAALGLTHPRHSQPLALDSCAGCVQELRWPPGPPLLRRSDVHGSALLHQRRHAPARARY